MCLLRPLSLIATVANSKYLRAHICGGEECVILHKQKKERM